MVLSSLLAFSSSCNESCFKDRVDVERTTSMEYKLFPIVWNGDVTYQFRRYHVPTSAPLNSTNIYIKEFLEFMQYWNLVLLLP